FFQAEDGIRDFHVTGVQTCALPIYCELEWLPQMVTQVTSSQPTPAFFARASRARLWSSRVMAVQRSAGMARPLPWAIRQLVLHEIGRASCRERVLMLVVKLG